MYSPCLGGTSETSLDTKQAQYPAGYTLMYSLCLGGTSETSSDTKQAQYPAGYTLLYPSAWEGPVRQAWTPSKLNLSYSL